LIRYCPSIRPDLITDLTPALPSLLAHAEAVQPLSDFFDLYANSREKKQLVRGFYPKEVRIFDGEDGKTGEMDMAETLEKMGEGQQRARVLEGVEKNVLGP
jgi:pumilio family protein 6